MFVAIVYSAWPACLSDLGRSCLLFRSNTCELIDQFLLIGGFCASLVKRHDKQSLQPTSSPMERSLTSKPSDFRQHRRNTPAENTFIIPTYRDIGICARKTWQVVCKREDVLFCLCPLLRVAHLYLVQGFVVQSFRGRCVLSPAVRAANKLPFVCWFGISSYGALSASSASSVPRPKGFISCPPQHLLSRTGVRRTKVF